MAKKWKVISKTKEFTECESPRGKIVRFLTPSGRFKLYGKELNEKTNMRSGEPLNDCAAGYRMGYRAALGEQAKIYKKRKKKSK